MNKKGMNLSTLVIMMVIMIAFMGFWKVGITKTNLIQKAKVINEDVNLLSIQELANMAYADIYFDNLTRGVRRELTAEEIRIRMLKNGTGEIDINLYNIVVANGDVFVTPKY